MCGISAYSSSLDISEINKNIFLSIHEKLKHRGPDDSGLSFDFDNRILMGHHRLSILDIDSSKQPFRFKDIELIFNGEIYNYLEIKSELIDLGYHFDTNGDTEVLIKAFHKWRKDAFMKLDGMFSCVFKENNKLYLVTDFFGEKPLYIYENKDDIYICSEALPIVDSLKIKFEPDISDLYYFLGNGFMNYEKQGFRNLKRLKPGYIIEIVDGKLISETNYFNRNILPNQNDDLSSKDIFEILLDSTKKRVRSDVNLGLFLSSGTDSVLTACFLKKIIGNDFVCFTSSKGSDDEEYYNANKICKYLEIDHKKVLFHDAVSTIDAPKKLIDLYTVPNDNLSGLAVGNLSSASNQNIKVAFVGTGADEIFAGYNKYKEAYSKRLLLDNNFLKRLEPFFIKKILKKFPKTIQISLLNKNLKFLAFKNMFLSDLIIENNLINHYQVNQNSDDSLINIFRQFDLDKTLPLSYNDSIDRGTMRHGVEARSIYLNKKLFNLTKNIKNKKLIENHPKLVLRKILYDFLPSEIVPKKKIGFTIKLSNFYNTFKNKRPNIKKLESEIKLTWDSLRDPNTHKLALRLLVLEEAYKRFS